MASRSLTVARRAAVAVCAPLARGFRAAAILSTRAEVVPTKKSQKQASLASILEKELQYEKEDNNTEANLKEIADSLEGWTLKNETGTSRFQVSRKWGSQTLVIDVDCNPIPTDEEEEEEEERERAEEDEEQPEGGMDGYRLLVTVVSGEGAGPKAGTLQFGCMVTDHLRVHKVATYPAGSKVPSAAEIFSGSEENPSYGGPNFEELDQAVQNGFYEYLAERGIDDTLAEKLGDFAASKEQAEYITWLETTKAFVQ